MTRPSLLESERKTRVLITLSKSIYENAKRKRLNVSRLCNASLAFYLGKPMEGVSPRSGLSPLAALAANTPNR